MCLASPAEVLQIDLASQQALVSLGGVQKAISIALLDEVTLGDFVLVHVGYALSRIDPVEAQRTLELMARAAEIKP